MEYLILTFVALMSLAAGIAAGNCLKKLKAKNKEM